MGSTPRFLMLLGLHIVLYLVQDNLRRYNNLVRENQSQYDLVKWSSMPPFGGYHTLLPESLSVHISIHNAHIEEVGLWKDR